MAEDFKANIQLIVVQNPLPIQKMLLHRLQKIHPVQQKLLQEQQKP